MFYSLNNVKSDFDRYDKDFLIFLIFVFLLGDELPDNPEINLDVSDEFWKDLTCIHLMWLNNDHKKKYGEYGW